MTEEYAEQESRNRIFNLVYWFFHKEDILRAARNFGNATCLQADTIKEGRPEIKAEAE